MPPQGIDGNVWRLLGRHSLGGRGAIGTYWVETWDAAKRPTAHGTAPSKELCDLNVHCAEEVGNLGFSERKTIRPLCLWIAKPAQGLNKQVPW